MSADATQPSPKTARDRFLVAVWLVLGLAAYWYAALAVHGAINARTFLPLFMALMMGSPVLAMTLAAAMTPLAPTLGYVAIRYWVLPNRTQDWRNTVALPLIVLPCMIVGSVVSGFVASLVFVSLQFLPAALNQLLLAVLIGLLSGGCLWGIERLATLVLFGRTEAAKLGASLCGAHAIGLTVIFFLGSLPAAFSSYVLHTAISQTWGKWLVLPIFVCGQAVHLLLAWRAWGGSRSAPPSARAIAGGVFVGFLAASVIGAAARAPSTDALHAIGWPLSYIAGWP